MRNNTIATQQGFGLLEVMIALLVSAIGLVGIAKLQILNTQSITTSYRSVQAIGHLEEMICRLRSNKGAATAGDYNIGNVSGMLSFSSLSVPSNNSSQADKGIYNWMQSLSNTISDVQTAINCDSDSLCVLAVHYTSIQGLQKHTLVIRL